MSLRAKAAIIQDHFSAIFELSGYLLSMITCGKVIPASSYSNLQNNGKRREKYCMENKKKSMRSVDTSHKGVGCIDRSKALRCGTKSRGLPGGIACSFDPLKISLFLPCSVGAPGPINFSPQSANNC